MNAIAELQPPRLPYHPAVEDRFQIDKSGWKALVEAVYPLAKTPDSVVMALSYCKARKLDPFKKPVHIVPMWDSKKKGYVETIWPGISEVRTTAFRTGQYAGCDEAEFGPTIEKTFTGKVKKGDSYVEQTVTVEFPEWCRMTVYRVLGDRVCKFVGPKVKWLESYATIGSTDLPNDMWQSRPEGQIEKCAEAAALRKAFPEELGNQLTAEEMEGRRVEGDFGGAEISEPVKRQPPAPPKAKEEVEDATVIEEKAPARRTAPQPTETKAEPTKVTSGRQQTQKQNAEANEAAYDPAPILAKIQEHLDGCQDDDTLEAVRAKHVMPLYDQLQPDEQEKAKDAYRAARDRIADAAEDAGEQQDQPEETAGDQQQDESDFPGDKPSALPPADKKPEKMNAAELEAHIRGYLETMTDAEALKKRWYMDEELREILPEPIRKELRGIWKARMDELRAAEGQG